MPKLYSSRYILKILQEQGFLFVSQKGSHIKLQKKGKPTLITIIPANKKEIPYGTFKTILLQTNLNSEFFKK
ncbi:type II toxin-antitoxin system HicA family toxin [Candidatus Gracilibacteria bacterium]|nr:type II toxin-antitoxin system HicA family toxin [Candidatus Gracilibacteria bacterium]